MIVLCRLTADNRCFHAKIVCHIQLVITLVLLFTLPLWSRAHGHVNTSDEKEMKVLTIREIIQIPGVKLKWCLFITSCAIEYTCGGWGSTFLVEYKHVLPEHTAKIVMYYDIRMVLGRFLSEILSARLNRWQIIAIGQCILGAALVLLLLPLPTLLSAVGLFMVGLGNGPLFPNFNYLTPQNFGKEASQSVIGTQMAASYAGIMVAPAVCGILEQNISMGIFPVYLFVFYCILLITTHRVKKILER